MKIVQIIVETVSWSFLLVLGGMIGLTALSNSNMTGSYHFFLVQSGSMEPSIMTGDIIVVNQQKQYKKNEAVTFTDNKGRRVTHRIVDIKNEGGKTIFLTKGDANRTSDNDSITADRVVGKVVLVVPKLGYLVAFSKSFWGLIVLVLLPSTLIVVDEVVKIGRNRKVASQNEARN